MTQGPAAGDGATSELMAAISEDVRRLIRAELQRARIERGDSLDSGRRAVSLLGVAEVRRVREDLTGTAASAQGGPTTPAQPR